MADYTTPGDPSTLIAGTGAEAGDFFRSATNYDLPNFVGELYSLIPAQTPFLSMAGGLTGGLGTRSVEFGWTVEGNATAAADQQQLEGAEVAAEHVIRERVTNVVEIHQEAVGISYSKQAAVGQVTPLSALQAENVQELGANVVGNEIAHQLGLKINKVARDVNLTFLTGAYQNPTTNVDPRKTRGILPAITTHATAGPVVGAAALKDAMDAMLIGMFSSETTIAPLIQPVIFCNGTVKVLLSQAYSSSGGLADRSRTVGGVNIETIITDFGTFGVVLDRYMPTDTLLLADMSTVAPVHMEIPGKGLFFTEPLAKNGAYDRAQLYGEIGLWYGPEQYHGKIAGIAAA